LVTDFFAFCGLWGTRQPYRGSSLPG
jgi:hypothetical protein